MLVNSRPPALFLWPYKLLNIHTRSPLSGSPSASVFSEKTPQGPCDAKLVTAKATGSPNYEPEIGMCAYLDKQWPEEAPHQIYACYARLFSVPMLVRLYRQVIRAHGVDTVVTIDGGSDSLRDPSKETLRAVAKVLSSRNDVKRLTIEGHTCSDGPLVWNEQLSRERAAVVGQLGTHARGRLAHVLAAVCASDAGKESVRRREAIGRKKSRASHPSRRCHR